MTIREVWRPLHAWRISKKRARRREYEHVALWSSIQRRSRSLPGVGTGLDEHVAAEENTPTRLIVHLGAKAATPLNGRGQARQGGHGVSAHFSQVRALTRADVIWLAEWSGSFGKKRWAYRYTQVCLGEATGQPRPGSPFSITRHAGGLLRGIRSAGLPNRRHIGCSLARRSGRLSRGGKQGTTRRPAVPYNGPTLFDWFG